MIGQRRLIGFAAAVIASAGFALAQGTGNPAGPGMHAGGWARRIDKIAAVLNLTPDQQAQVQSIFQTSFSQAQPLFSQMRNNRQAIEQLVKSGTSGQPFDTQIQTLANTQASLVSQMTVIHAKAMAQVWNLLSPDQRQKADQLRDLIGPGFGQGMGMMGHGPRGARSQQAPPAPVQ